MKKSSLLIYIILFLCSCKSDDKHDFTIQKNDLIGEWSVQQALRNGKITKSIEGGNFVFLDDNTMRSNLLQSSEIVKFTLDNHNISIEGDPLFKLMKIRSMVKDTLVLTSKVNVFDMEFLLVKKTDNDKTE